MPFSLCCCFFFVFRSIRFFFFSFKHLCAQPKINLSQFYAQNLLLIPHKTQQVISVRVHLHHLIQCGAIEAFNPFHFIQFVIAIASCMSERARTFFFSSCFYCNFFYLAGFCTPDFSVQHFANSFSNFILYHCIALHRILSRIFPVTSAYTFSYSQAAPSCSCVAVGGSVICIRLFFFFFFHLCSARFCYSLTIIQRATVLLFDTIRYNT